MATIQENIQRIMGGKDSIRNSIINKGLEVPEGLRVDTYSDFILHIGEEYSMEVSDVYSTSVWDEINRIKSAEDSIKSAIREKGVDVPEGLRIDDLSVYVDMIETGPQPLTFTMLGESGSIQLGKYANPSQDVNFEYNLNNSGWQHLSNTEKIPLSLGDKIQFRGDKVYTQSSSTGWYGFIGSGSCSVSGSPLSLINNESMKSYQFYKLFVNMKSLTDASELILPTNLTNLCCSHMFEGCSNLATAPELPATTLASSCYTYMFQDCTSLTNAPELPATTLADYCYQSMFEGCTSMTAIYCNALSSSNNWNMWWLNYVRTSGTLYRNPNSSITDWKLPSTWTIEDWIQ